MAVAVAAPPAPPVPTARTIRWRDAHPLLSLAVSRMLIGLVTLLVVSLVIFLATEVLPGNAAYAILGHTATPQRLRALESQLGLNRGLASQYWSWLSGLFTGRLGTSLANGDSVWGQVAPRLADSAFLVFIAGIIGSVLGVAIGAVAALRKDGWFDHISSVLALAVTALPEFVVAIGLIIVFATLVWHLLPAVSLLPPGPMPGTSRSCSSFPPPLLSS